jgi:hypothetical protein
MKDGTDFAETQKKLHKMAKKMLHTIAPMFKGESVDFVATVLVDARNLLLAECLFTLCPSTKRSKN